jgi:hypothetical protein
MSRIKPLLYASLFLSLLISCNKALPEEYVEPQLVLLKEHNDPSNLYTQSAWSTIVLIENKDCWDPSTLTVAKGSAWYLFSFYFPSYGELSYDGEHEIVLSYRSVRTDGLPTVNCYIYHLSRWATGTLKISGNQIDAYLPLEDLNKTIHLHYNGDWLILDATQYVSER